MGKTMCPGQDTAFWKPGDIFEVACGDCGHEIEFFKDDASRRCRSCGQKVMNPRLNLGCAQWCEHAAECLGFDPKERAEAAAGGDRLVDKILAALKNRPGLGEGGFQRAVGALEAMGPLLDQEGGRPAVALAAALLHPLAEEPEGMAEVESLLKSVGLDGENREAVAEALEGKGPEAGLVAQAAERASEQATAN